MQVAAAGVVEGAVEGAAAAAEQQHQAPRGEFACSKADLGQAAPGAAIRAQYSRHLPHQHLKLHAGVGVGVPDSMPPRHG